MKKLIFHIDVNSAFLSWEAAYRLKHLGGHLDLREVPSAVAGDRSRRHGIILAKSIPAKKYKIQTGESISDALCKCPDLCLVPPHYDLYEKSSKAFINLLKEFTPIVEQYSIDEAFIDMSGTQRLFGSPIEAANTMKDRIQSELGFTVNIGVSSNKLLAKMASDFKKPNLVHTLFSYEIKEKLWPLPVSELFFVGSATAKKLLQMGIKTIGELAKSDPVLLKIHLKKHGEMIWNFANGYDTSVVEADLIPKKGYGNSTTIAFDVTEAETAKRVLLALAETVGTRLRRNNVKAKLISVGIKDYNFQYASHQMVLADATNITGELHKMACRLFDELWDGMPIRHLGIHTGKMIEGESSRQMHLFDAVDYEKQERLDLAVDQIRNRYGIDSIKRAVFLTMPIDHMSGGITREKQKVDYSKLRIE